MTIRVNRRKRAWGSDVCERVSGRNQFIRELPNHFQSDRKHEKQPEVHRSALLKAKCQLLKVPTRSRGFKRPDLAGEITEKSLALKSEKTFSWCSPLSDCKQSNRRDITSVKPGPTRSNNSHHLQTYQYHHKPNNWQTCEYSLRATPIRPAKTNTPIDHRSCPQCIWYPIAGNPPTTSQRYLVFEAWTCHCNRNNRVKVSGNKPNAGVGMT